ncbi:EF-P lysine aminoacylase EpmA [Thiohalobacter sp. IOR34]|uniref:EF-P lysine aminoacylase EpmA n=1 Tax=Thiohalobacter sp. IOR34 TaxID=3057176 RepID=UPI0025B0BDE7|nr:EF-P lysine aminoacylase EpmA [Thiohalobacter sp. IOR34]WJW76247.1 EF-P lysine aminoacylase EpmA [Thiohalobacter sp. IOR34]
MPVDDWRPSARIGVLQLRARLLARLRDFFARRGLLEVDTPALSVAAVTTPQIDSFVTRYTGPGAAAGRSLYLHSSPEFPMKRLLAAGSGPIWQLCKVFRNGEAGTRHNPEFSLLEWYRPGFSLAQLMDEVEALVGTLLDEGAERPPFRRIAYDALFRRFAGVDGLRAPPAELRTALSAAGIEPPAGLPLDDADPWRDLLMSLVIEPQLQGAWFVHDYPVSQAALARIRPGEPPVAERFELYLDGLELANGFHELADAAEQCARFERENAARRAAGLPELPLDERLLAALEAGLPDCCGVALGFDRLLMWAAGAGSIEAVLAFPVGRA